VANSAAHIGDAALWTERMRIARAGGLATIADAAQERWFTAPFRAREPAIVETFRARMARTSIDGYVGCCAALRDADLGPLVSAVKCPTLVIAGTHDAATPPDAARWLAGAIEGAQYVELGGAHLSSVECAEAFNGVVLNFLSAAS
jgi:3-oxoadipate enol-lactonase